MDTHIKIKQENADSDAASENETELFSKDLTDAGTLNNDSELEPIMKIKVENSFPDLCSGEEDFSKNIFQNETVTYSTECEIQIKEAAPISDFHSKSESGSCSTHCVTNVESWSNLDYEVNTKMEIKQEVCWPESPSAVCDVTEDGTNEHSPSKEPPRHYTKADSDDSNDKPASNSKQNYLIRQDNKRYKCDSCGKNYTKLSSLKRHNMSHEGKMPYKCDICDKNFKDLSNLKRHSLTHVTTKPFKCDLCEKSFRDLWNLKRHNFNHNNQKPYKCDICEKDFAVMSSLKRHNLIHEGKKPHKCNICGKAFIDSSHLKRHNLMHESQKPLKCDICEKTFTYVSNLKTHNLIHEGKMPHKCSICEKSFAHLLGLKTHNYMIHERRKVKHT